MPKPIRIVNTLGLYLSIASFALSFTVGFGWVLARAQYVAWWPCGTDLDGLIGMAGAMQAAALFLMVTRREDTRIKRELEEREGQKL